MKRYLTLSMAGFCAIVPVVMLVSCDAQKLPVAPKVEDTATPTSTLTLTATPSRTPSHTPTGTLTPSVTFTPTATFTRTFTPGPAGGTVLSAGDAAIVGFSTNGTQSDYFAFILLKDVAQGTSLNISDENWDGAHFATSDGGMITWTADRAYPAGTVVETLPTSDGSSASTHSYAVKVSSGGVTYSNITGPGKQTGTYAFDPSSPIQVTTVDNTGNGLTGWSSGDQFLLFQGPAVVGESGSGVTFIGALTYNTVWLTGAPNPALATGAGCYLPPGLTDGVDAMAVTVTVGNGGHYNCANGTTGTPAALRALLYDQSKWTLNMSANDLPDPVLFCDVTVDP